MFITFCFICCVLSDLIWLFPRHSGGRFFSYHAFTQRMGIASSRTTDTGVFIKPTAETGWERDITLAKKEKRSSPLVELDVFFFWSLSSSFWPCSSSPQFLLFKDTSIGSHQPSAQSYHNQYYYYQPIVSSDTLTHGPFLQSPIRPLSSQLHNH